ncbi:MAG: phage tail tape measure protein [Selenomonadaceae bacterium]|nr:phage tail tape measure protein [Selenomonadaceae bacterium]
MANRTIEIIVDVNDKTGGKLKGAQRALIEMDKTAQRLANRFKSFSTTKYRAMIELIDRVTEPGTRINNLLRRIAGSAWRVSLHFADGALDKVRRVEAILMRITSRAYNIAVNVKDNLKGKFGGLLNGAAMGAGMLMPLGGAMGVGFGVANGIQAYAGFEQAMSRVQAIRQLSKDSTEMQALTQLAKDLGMQTAWTRQQVGQAMEYQALAGWSTNQILQSTPHLLNLASAGGLDLGRTSDIVTDAMTAFGLRAEETYTNKQGREVNAVEHFADMLAKMQAISNTDISQAGEAFKYSANVIGAMFSGQDISKRMQATEDAMIMTGLMANAGIKGSMAGTATRAIFSRMTSENRNAFRALGAMGVEYKDEGGNILMPGEIMRNLSRRFKEGIDPNQLLTFAEEMQGEKIHADTRRKLESFIEQTAKNGGKMGSADMAKMSAMLAGQEAMSGLLAVLMGDWDAMAEKMDNVNGTAKEMAETMLDNLAGSFTKLGSAWDAFQQGFMEGSAGEGLRAFVDSLTELVTRANKLFSDGIQIGDFGKIIGDIIGRLKNKFLELDGIGSVLAGGALAAGLMKIITLSQRALNAIRNVGRASVIGGATSTTGVSAAQKVGTMHVSAGVVNVNGKVGAGGAAGRNVGNTAIIDNYNKTKERIRGTGTPPAPVASRFSGMGSAAAGGAAFAGIFGLMDVMNLKAMNAERLATAAPEERAQIIRENRQAEWEAGAGLTGSVIGAALGSALGSFAGPIGTAIGGIVGGMIGQWAGTTLGANAPEETKGASDYYGTKKKASVEETIWSGFGKEIPTASAQANRRLVGAYRSLGESATRLTKRAEQMNFFNAVNEKHGAFSPFQHDAALNATQDYYAQQRERMMTNPSDFYGTKDLWGGGRAEAAELNADQMAQMQAMERGEVVTAPTVALGEVQTEGFAESLYSQLESVAETAGEFISSLGSSITDGLASAMAGAGEIFAGLSDSISAGLEAASSMATGALESIQFAFSSAKDTIHSTWGELPSFFEGVFSGLGGAAQAAGSAIYSGLTSVIGSVIGAWESASATISGIISQIGSMASSAGAGVSGAVSSVIARVRGHAEGGFVTSPELSWLGERGAELVLPLTDRERSLELLGQASGMLGLDSGLPSDSVVSQGTAATESLDVGGVTINASFTINGGEDVMQTIQENLESLADKVAAKFAVNIKDCYRNRALA